MGDPILKMKKTGDLYKLLAACFYNPRKTLYLEEGIFENLAALSQEICPEVVSSIIQMGKVFLSSDEEDLLVEYAGLFVGPYELKAPPYGSVFLDRERKVMGDSTLQVMKLYEEAELVMDPSFKELPDHIAVELEFMYYLSYKEAEALEHSDEEKALAIREIRHRFFNEYLRPWVPSFSEKIKQSTSHPFYIALADSLATFILKKDE